jgi:ATP-dependent helicase/nuclease subunit A
MSASLSPREQARADQAKAAAPDASAWVAANAGSGKTKVLIDRVARLLLQPGVEPDQILCVTYTKAAATEMQDRLFQRLGDWCVMNRDELADQLAELEGQQTLTDAQIGRARELFASALETPGGLRIETIHAFCGRVLRRFPLEAGIAPGFHELDEAASDDLWDDAFRALGARIAEGQPGLVEAARIVAEDAGSELSVLKKLHAKRAAVEAFIDGELDGAVEVLRLRIGAGEHTAADIIETAMGANLPREDLARAAGLFRSGSKSDIEGAACIDIALSDAPAEERLRALWSIPFTAKGEPRKTVFTKPLRASAPLLVELFDNDVPQGRETRRLAAVMQALAARQIFEKSAALLRLADQVFRDFRIRKGEQAGLDFDDLIQFTGRLLDPDRVNAAEWVLWKLDGGIAHLLLDEAQDTSPEQWKIIRALTDDIFAGHGVERATKRTLFVVGDQKQSIYSFQGADPEHFLREGRDVRVRSELTRVDLNTPSLAMSFRSSPQVLDYVDEVFDPAHIPDGAPFSLEVPSERDYVRHVAHRADQAGVVELWPLDPPVGSEDPDPWDAPVDQQSQTSPKALLAKRIALYIRRQIDGGARIWEKGQPRAAQPGDYLVLVKGRTGGLFDNILQALKTARLPVAGADRIQLLDSLPVQDMLNLMRFALCPEDDLVLAEILKGPFVGLDDDDLLELAYDRPADLWAQVRASANPRFASARATLSDLFDRRHQAPYEFLARTLECALPSGATGWDRLLARLGDPAREPMTALLDRAAAFDASAPPSLELFLAAVERHGGEVKRELSGAGDAVRVMTVHGAKGLQAPVVILPDTTSAPKYDVGGLFVESDGCPIWVGGKDGDTLSTAPMRGLQKERALREHRRLLYVALTRAQDRLVVCGAWNGQNKKTGRDDASWYALCEAGMGRLRERGLALEIAEADGQADRNLHRYGENMSALAATLGGPDALEIPGWISSPAPKEPGAQRILAPSSLGGAEPPPIAPFGPGRAKRLRRGRLIHSLFEHLPEIAAERREEAGKAFLARQPDLKPKERAEMLAAALGAINDPRFAGVFAAGGRAEAAVVGELGPNLINGRVDRLVIAPHEILIVDYKTDRPAPDDVSHVGHAYVTQLAAYRHILGRNWPNRPVRCLLVWTDGPKLMEIPPRMLDAAISDVLR